MFLLFLAMFVTGPWIDSGEGPNRCYLVNAQMEQIHGPCKPEETRGYRRP